MQARIDIQTARIIQQGLELAATESVAHAWVFLIANDIHRHTILRILSDYAPRRSSDIFSVQFAEETMP